MNKKTYIIIAVILLVIVVVAIVVLALNSPKVKNDEKKTTNEEQVSNLPTDIPKIDVLRVDNIDNSTQIKNSYDSYASQDYEKFKYYEADGISDVFAPSDKDANLIPIETFLNSIDANINPKIKSIIEANYYGLFYCINEKKQKEYGIALDLNDKDPVKTKNNFDSAGDAMSVWELYLLKDMQNVLFPADKLNEAELNQSLFFKDGKYRYAEVNLPNGKSSINYKVVGDSLNLIIIATSQDCVKKAIGLFEALD
jgi:hypothetical protein